MKSIDFFVSYSSADKEKVEALVSSLESMGAKCFYAPRDVIGRYARAVCDAIENSKVFLLCLSNESAKSEHVLNEIEMAYSHKKYSNGDIVIQPVCIDSINIDGRDFDEIMYYIRRINFIIPEDTNSSDLIAKEIAKSNSSIFNETENKKDRTISMYFMDSSEKDRLEIQNKLVKKFDQDVYEKVFNNFNLPTILDVGCGNSDVITNRFESTNYTLVGIDKDSEVLKDAKQKHPFGKFYECDLESDDFYDKLEDIMEELQIKEFDIIHISMVLLHLKSQYKLLRILRRVLSQNGILIIKDIDDGLNFAYPDDNEDFARIFKICEIDKIAGERKNGRQIYTNLIRAGYKQISLEKQGFSSIGLNHEDKESLFNLYCKFVLDDIEWLHKKEPNNATFAKEYEWYSQNYKKIFDQFMMDEFVFSIGFQIYLAKK